jgi:hypothetical protein
VADVSYRFGWIGPTRRASLRGKIAACAQAWLADWHMDHDGKEPCVQDAPIIPFSPDEACVLQAGPEQPGLMVVIAGDELMRLGNGLAGIRESTATLSQEIGRAALENLAHRIGHLTGNGDVVEHGQSTWPQALTREELGAAGLAFDAAGVTINLAFSRESVDALAPPKPAVAGAALAARTEAAGAVALRLTAGFHFGTISMRELADLRVGEVLVGECPLDTPVRLLAPGHAHLGSARMGRIGNHLAVALTQQSISQENA